MPQNIKLDDIYKEAAKDCEDVNLASDIYLTIVPSTFAFLSKEKFIEYDQKSHTIIGSPIFYSAVLTLKGLTLLRTIPQSLKGDSQMTFFERLKDSINKEGTKTAVSETIKLLFNCTAGYIAS